MRCHLSEINSIFSYVTILSRFSLLGLKCLQQFLAIFFLWSEMKDFARLSKIGLSNIWKETRKEEISFHGWMLTAFAGLFYAKIYVCECHTVCVWVSACMCDWIR